MRKLPAAAGGASSVWSIGMVTGARSVAHSANADFYRGRGSATGKYVFEHVGPLSKQNIEGHDVSPTTVDFDDNGIPDFLGGAEDGRFYFLKNPRG